MLQKYKDGEAAGISAELFQFHVRKMSLKSVASKARRKKG